MIQILVRIVRIFYLGNSPIHLGFNQSAKSVAYYVKQEERNVKLMKVLLIYGIFIIATIYLLPILFPVSYAIFGFPKPKQWYLPYPTM